MGGPTWSCYYPSAKRPQWKEFPAIVTATLAQPVVEQKLQIVVSSASEVGGRESNEDALLVTELPQVGAGETGSEAGLLLAVADGMGGYQRGEVASQMAIQALQEAFAEDPGADTALLMKQAFRRANERIYSGGQGADPPQMMGTTLVAVGTRGKYATIASIGDSRAYLIRANRLTQVTKDHSLVAEQVARGQITAEEARESPHRNVLTHALGHRAKLDGKMPNIFEIVLLPEDRLVLCTDGFVDVLPEEDLREIAESSSMEASARALVDVAVERGASDNVTAVVASVLPAREPPVALDSAAARRGVPIYVFGLAALAVLLLIIAILALS
jgi:protein phosphatase